jgi:hypothetical protein
LKSALIQNRVGRILLLIFLANVFYDDPLFHLYKRVLYTVFIYTALYEMFTFLYVKDDLLEEEYKMPFFNNVYLPILILLLLFNVARDFLNPGLNLITLFNNPFALLSAAPILMFLIGSKTKDIDFGNTLFYVALVSFSLVFIFPFFGKVKYYQGYICINALLPLYILAKKEGDYNIFFVGFLIVISLIFSQLSDYRVIALRYILFISLFVSASVVKRSGFLKLLLLAVVSFCIYHFVMNLQELLELFKSIIGVKDFDDDDTRAFLFEEVFSELNSYEYIVGRGFLGTYFSEYFLMMLVKYHSYGDHYERFTVEVGYLELLLKGGYLWFVLYVSPLLFSAFKGFFYYYKKPMVFSISIFLFTEFFLMFIENIPYFSIQFSLCFFLAGYSMRLMNQNENINHNSLV